MNEGQQLQNQAKIKEVNDGRGDTISSNNKNQEEVEHDEVSYSSYDEQVTVQSPGTWVTEDLTSSTLEQYHHKSLDTHVGI